MPTDQLPKGPAVPVIAADWQAPSHVKAFNSTRLGGISQSPYDSLNLGLHVDDDPIAVMENRERLRFAHGLPACPHWLQQVHGIRVLDVPGEARTVEHAKPKGIESAEVNTPLAADAAFTRRTDHVLCVLTADCLPVVITNASGTKLAVAHAGWKGLANGVLEACLQKFSNDAEDLHIWFGPAIGPAAFEVGNEVMDAFVCVDDAQRVCFTKHPDTNEKKHADIYALARRIIERNSCTREAGCFITGGQWCTFSDARRFYSYRRDGVSSGRMALVAWLAPQK